MIYHGDLFDVLPTLDAESIDACVTDPPYGIGFMGKEWDSFKPGEEANRIVPNIQIASDNPNLKGRTRGPASSPSAVEYDRSLHGQREFQAWTERWAREVYRVLKPGAHLLVCGAPRSFHRMTCGLEDAGFVIRDVLSWNFGSGFPKSLNIGDGRGTALKPGWESITVARKPLSLTQEQSTIVANLLQLEAQLWSLLPVSVAAESFGLSLVEHSAATCASARWSAADRSSTWADLFGAMDTSQCVSVMSTSLSIVSSWNDILADAFGPTSTSITETKSNTTINWKTLRYCSLALTPRDIIKAEMSAPGSRFAALPAARYLSAALMSMHATHELSALGPAMSAVQQNCLDADGLTCSTDVEFFALARKPFRGTVTTNVAQHGTGALNIDACRIDGEVTSNPLIRNAGGYEGGLGNQGLTGAGRESDGRWPANVLLDEEAADLLDHMAPFTGAGGSKDNRGTTHGFIEGRTSVRDDVWDRADARGGASRFYYVAKPSREERDYGCEGLPALSGGEATDRKDGSAGVNSPRAGAGRTGGGRNSHPTVKPVELMRWLVRLVTPVNGTVLDPFTGSGTTGMACRYELREFIGIEREADYVEIAERRITAVAPLFHAPERCCTEDRAPASEKSLFEDKA